MNPPHESDDFSRYERISRNIRKTILGTVHRTKSPHIGPSFSIVEALTALYFKFLRNCPERSGDPERDRFILSKGHACPALYAALAERGFITREDLEKFAVNGGALEQHPSMNLGHGIELSTGSSGTGFPWARAWRLPRKRRRKGTGSTSCSATAN